MTSTSAMLKGMFKQPAFLITVIFLIVAAAGLNVTVQGMKLHFKKQSVPLRMYPGTDLSQPLRKAALEANPLKSIPERFGHWVQVSEDLPLSHEMEDVLQTRVYVFRDYLDVDKAGDETLKQFDGKHGNERLSLIRGLQLAHPDWVMNCAVTYYTGGADTVAHIPDRCYIADGFQPTTYDDARWALSDGGSGSSTREVPARFIVFEDQAGGSRQLVTRNVAYFFQVNGHYESDPLQVRKGLQNLFEKYGYYAKIELMTVTKDTTLARETMIDFLDSALPQIEKCLPDWKQVLAGDVK